MEKMNEKLIALVINQIKEDIKEGDITALEELLKDCPVEAALAYLPE